MHTLVTCIMYSTSWLLVSAVWQYLNSVLKRSTNSVGPMFTLIALGIMCVLIGVICTIFISLLVVSLARRQSTDYSHIVSFVGRVISCLLMCKINSRFFKSQKYRFIPGLVTMFLYVLCVSIELLITNKSCLKLWSWKQ